MYLEDNHLPCPVLTSSSPQKPFPAPSQIRAA